MEAIIRGFLLNGNLLMSISQPRTTAMFWGVAIELTALVSCTNTELAGEECVHAVPCKCYCMDLATYISYTCTHAQHAWSIDMHMHTHAHKHTRTHTCTHAHTHIHTQHTHTTSAHCPILSSFADLFPVSPN